MQAWKKGKKKGKKWSGEGKLAGKAPQQRPGECGSCGCSQEQQVQHPSTSCYHWKNPTELRPARSQAASPAALGLKLLSKLQKCTMGRAVGPGWPAGGAAKLRSFLSTWIAKAGAWRPARGLVAMPGQQGAGSTQRETLWWGHRRTAEEGRKALMAWRGRAPTRLHCWLWLDLEA